MLDRFPAQVYADTVLRQNFEDAKKYFLDSLLEIHHAHTRMLACQGILTPGEERELIAALDGLDRAHIETAGYDGGCEDLFFFIETLLEQACGRDLAGKMHTARSRNDIALTLYRMTARVEMLNVSESISQLRRVLLKRAGDHL